MPDEIAEFRRDEFLPPGASPLLASILLAIEFAQSPADLRAWCEEHMHVQHRLALEEHAIAASAALRRWALWQLEALGSLAALGTWWGENQDTLRRLVPVDLARVVEAKDSRKARLAAPQPGLAGPTVVLPYRGREAVQSSGRLL